MVKRQKSTFDLVRRLGLALDGAAESTMYGEPALKVGGQMFACMASHRSAEPGTLVVRMDFDQRDALVAEAPETYYLTDHYVGYPCVCVRLSKISTPALRDILKTAWRFVAARPRRKPTARK